METSPNCPHPSLAPVLPSCLVHAAPLRRSRAMGVYATTIRAYTCSVHVQKLARFIRFSSSHLQTALEIASIVGGTQMTFVVGGVGHLAWAYQTIK